MRDEETIAEALSAAVRRFVPGASGISRLTRLSGGASQETWAFDADVPGATAIPLILRRAPGGGGGTMGSTAASLETEATILRLAHGRGVAVPAVPYVLTPEDGIGSAYVMERLEGETIARKILRDDAFAAARPRMARQCGETLALIHALPVGELPPLAQADAPAQWQQYRDIYDGFAEPRPVFDYAFRWLGERLPNLDRLVLVHGDFRNGNLMVGPDGVRAVLDWELVHLGDPMEDLGWICVNSWRFGVSHKPVGGFGDLDDLIAGYEAAGGGQVDPARVAFWQVFGTLKWGIMCMMMVSAFRTASDRSVERAAIGRRASETEIDLLNLIGA